MVEDAELGAGQSGAVHDAGMHQLVENQDVVFAEQGGEGANGGGVTGGEGQRGSGAFESGECFLEFMKRRQRTANQPGGARARAKFFDRMEGGFLERRMIGETQ